MGYGSGVAMNCGVGCRRGLDPELFWLWSRPAATAPIRPPAWEPPYAMGAALEKAKRKKKKKGKQTSKTQLHGLSPSEMAHTAYEMRNS